MNEVKIKKAKIKDGLFLEAEYSEDLEGHDKNDHSIYSTVPVHVDLKTAFERLDKHLAVLCSQVKAKGKDVDAFDHPLLPKFTVKSFTIRGNDENEGVVISGSLDGDYGVVNLNTPFTKYESDYPFASGLSEDIAGAVYEVEQYLFHGKRAPEKQMELDFSDFEDLGGGDDGESVSGDLGGVKVEIKRTSLRKAQ